MKFLIIVLLSIPHAFATELRDFRGRVDHTPPRHPFAQGPMFYSFTHGLRTRGLNIELTTTRTAHNVSQTQNPPETYKTQYRLNQAIVGRRTSISNSASWVRARHCTYIITRTSLSNGVLRLEDTHISRRGCPSEQSVLAQFNANPDGDFVRGHRYVTEFHMAGGLLRFGAPQPAEVEEAVPASSATVNPGVNDTGRGLVDKDESTTRTPDTRSPGISAQ